MGADPSGDVAAGGFMRRVGCARAASALPCVGHVSGPTLSGPQFFAAPCVAVPASSYGYSDDSDDEAKEIVLFLKVPGVHVLVSIFNLTLS